MTANSSVVLPSSMSLSLSVDISGSYGMLSDLWEKVSRTKSPLIGGNVGRSAVEDIFERMRQLDEEDVEDMDGCRLKRNLGGTHEVMQIIKTIRDALSRRCSTLLI